MLIDSALREGKKVMFQKEQMPKKLVKGEPDKKIKFLVG